MKIALLITRSLGCCYLAEGDGKTLVCYVMAWSVYRPAEGKFDMEDIDPHLCTHIIYSYSMLNESTNSIQGTDLWADNNMGNIEKLVDLKEENSKLKIMTSIGGWSEGSEKFSKMAKSPQLRETFIKSVMAYLEENKLDGLDIDWQFPTQRGGKKSDKRNFVLLLQELRKEFDKKKYVLSVRLLGRSYVVDPAYDLPSISEAVDFINLKSYEYHGSWEPKTGVFAPLQSQNEDNVEFSVNLFLEGGVDRSKLLLGLSSQGNAFLIDDPVTNGIYLGQKSSDSFKGPWWTQQGLLGYNEICWELTKSRLWTQHWDKISQTPYAIHGKQFTSFENRDSVDEKMKLVSSKNLGGVSMYSLDTDDFKGLCYNEKFILTNTVKNALTAEASDKNPTDFEEEDKHKPTFESSVLTQEFFR